MWLFSVRILNQYETGTSRVLGDLCRIETRQEWFTHGRYDFPKLANGSFG